MQIHHLFYSADVTQVTLHRRITPTQLQREQQQARWQDLRDYLTAEIGRKTGYQISSWLQGSYKFGTQIRPAKLGDEFDIDLGIYFNWAGGPDATNESPQALKAHIQSSLENYAVDAEDDVLEVVRPAKERCSRIRFAGDFHIDVPTYHLDPQRDTRDLATEKFGWEVSDPKQLWLWFQRQFSDEDTLQVRRLIRYFKMWGGLQLANRPSSVLLTVLVVEAYLRLTEQQATTDDLAVRHVAAAIWERLTHTTVVENPVDRQEDLNRLSRDDLSGFLTGLESLIETADAATRASSA